MKITIKVKNPDIDQVSKDLRDKIQATIKVIHEEIIKLVSAPSLPRGVHPYARRFARGEHVEPVVHVNTGRLRSAIKIKDNGIVFDLDKAPYIEYVREGTSTMLPRPFIKKALENSQDRLKEIWG